MTNDEGSDRLTVKLAYCSWKASLHTALFYVLVLYLCTGESLFSGLTFGLRSTQMADDGHPTSLAFLLFWLTNYCIYFL